MYVSMVLADFVEEPVEFLTLGGVFRQRAFVDSVEQQDGFLFLLIGFVADGLERVLIA